jgi:hypothetical protein
MEEFMRFLNFSRIAVILIATVAVNGCAVVESSVSSKGTYQPASNQKVGDTCEDDTWCRTGLRCTDKKCQPCGCLKEGAACTMTGECGSDLYCSGERKCAPSGETEEDQTCATTADCQRGLVCAVDGFSMRCVFPGKKYADETCSSTLDCAAGLICDTEVITSDNSTDSGQEDIDTQTGETVCQSPKATSSERPVMAVWSGVQCEKETGAPVAYFDVPRASNSSEDFYRLPFPNDIRRTAKGLDLSGRPEPPASANTPIINRYWQAAEEDLSGFAVNPVIVFRFSADVSADTLNGDNIHFKDITPGSPTYNLERNRRWQYNPNQTNYICPNSLSVSSSATLRPNTTYVVYITTGIVPDAGSRYTRSDDLDALLASSEPTDSELAIAYKAYAPFRAWLTESKTPSETILNATVFTTQDPEAMVAKLRSAVDTSAMPAVSDVGRCGGITTSSCDTGEGGQCGTASSNFIEIHGRIALPVFQQGTAPYETPEQGGAIALNADGTVKSQGTANVCFALTLPTQAMQDTGFPLLIFGHGTGGGFTAAVSQGFAEEFAVGKLDDPQGSVPTATLTIDLPAHGDRRGTSTRSPEELFFNYLNPRAARDNILQGAADLMGLVRWARAYSVTENSSPVDRAIKFNPERIAIFGHSQGATHTSLMLPYEPAVVGAVLSGQGGYLSQSLLNKTKPNNIAATVPFALMDPDSKGALIGGVYHPMIALFQTFFERVDPLNFAYRISKEPTSIAPTGHHLFMTYGLEDNYTPIQTQKAYAMNAELTVVRPELIQIAPNSSNQETLKLADAPLKDNVPVGGINRTIGLRQYSPSGGIDGHFIATTAGTDGRADAVRFLLQSLAGLSPQIGKK